MEMVGSKYKSYPLQMFLSHDLDDIANLDLLTVDQHDGHVLRVLDHLDPLHFHDNMGHIRVLGLSLGLISSGACLAVHLQISLPSKSLLTQLAVIFLLMNVYVIFQASFLGK